MKAPRVFRDYKALVIATGLHQDRLQAFLKQMGFSKIRTTDQDKQAPFIIKQTLPELVITIRNLPVFSGMQILFHARSEEETAQVPFLILGDKEDLKPGGLGEKVKEKGSAVLIAEPITEESFFQAVTDLLGPGVDENRETAYARKDEAQEAARSGDMAQAEELYKASLESYPGDVACLLGLAKALTAQNKRDEAEDAYFKVLEKDNASLQAFLGLAELYEKYQENELAVDVLRQALPIAQSMKIKGSSKARIHFYLGEFELRLERLGAAEEAFKEAIELDPENPDLRTDIGDSYSDHGLYEESEEHYQAALAMDPDMAHTFNRLGIAYRKQGKYDRALALYEQARTRHPEDEHLLFNMARTHYEAGDIPNSIGFLNEALSLDPEFTTARSMLSKIMEERTKVAPTKGS